MKNDETVLDNPVWFSITEKHTQQAIDYGNIKIYHPDFTPFGAFINEEDTAKALIERAKEFYQKDQEDITKRIKDLGLQDDLINHKGLTPGMLVTLGEQKILKLEDELKYTEGFLKSVRKKLSNERFVSGAPEQVVASEKKKDADAVAKIETLKSSLINLK